MLEVVYECPDCFAQKVVVVKEDEKMVYRCEACGHVFAEQEWYDIHNYLYDELESQYDETEMEEIWDKFD